MIGLASGPGHGYEENVLGQVLLVALLITAVVVGDTAASDAASHVDAVEAVSLCRTVRVSGGDDIVDERFAGTLAGRVLLKPGGRASALIWLNPGRCDRSAAVTFGFAARAGWGTRSVSVMNEMCNDGTGHIDVGRFRPV
jgi:hypothetical protein